MTISVLDILEAIAGKYPDKTVCIDSAEQLTYSQLTRKAKIIGYALSQELKARQKPVVLFLEKSCKCLTAMLGALYSGNIYVPMDTKTPLERLKSILSTLDTDCILTSAKDKRLLDKIGYTGEAYLYETLMEDYQDRDGSAVLAQVRDGMLDTDLMYILFTSGSTGVPKGVAIRNRSVLDYIDAYVSQVGITERDVVGNQAPFYNDMSIRDIFMSIAVGGTVCIIPQTYFMSPKKLLEYMRDNQVTYTCWAPTAYGIVSQFDGLAKVRPDKLHKMLYSGEVMPIPVLAYWKNYYPNADFYQLYGPTEITGVCLFHKITKAYRTDEKIPLGRPFQNTGILLLDGDDREVTPSQVETPGEICVYGTCLAAGYYNNPEKTREAFVQNPLTPLYPNLMYRTGDLAKWDKDGNLIFISRKDYQIKHLGRRIELGEIEAAMQALEEIKLCCCVHNREKDELVLYYVGDLDAREIMLRVRDTLPKHMIPTVYHKEDTLPVLSNGKLNRKLMDAWGNKG